MSTKHKKGPGREYPPEQLAIYAQHKDKRALVRPLACQGGEGCWVELGPPGLNGRNPRCAKCEGTPRPIYSKAPIA